MRTDARFQRESLPSQVAEVSDRRNICGPTTAPCRERTERWSLAVGGCMKWCMKWCISAVELPRIGALPHFTWIML
jgi:hypothetical protein